MLRVGLLVFCLIAAPMVAQAQNLILNHSFEDDTDDPTADPAWSSWFSADNALVAFSYDSVEAADGEKSMKAEILQSSDTNWHIGLTQTGLNLTAGQEYTLTFWAKAEANRPIGMEVKREPGGMPWQGVTGGDFDITTEWAEYTQSFTPEIDYPEENGLPAMLGYWLAADPATIWFDFVHIYEGPYVEILPSPTGPSAVQPTAKLTTTWAGIRTER